MLKRQFNMARRDTAVLANPSHMPYELAAAASRQSCRDSEDILGLCNSMLNAEIFIEML